MLENEELVMQLRVVRECQNELATELVDYQDKYAEILELLRETQEQLKQQNKRNLPTARSGFNANHYSSAGCRPFGITGCRTISDDRSDLLLDRHNGT